MCIFYTAVYTCGRKNIFSTYILYAIVEMKLITMMALNRENNMEDCNQTPQALSRFIIVKTYYQLMKRRSLNNGLERLIIIVIFSQQKYNRDCVGIPSRSQEMDVCSKKSHEGH